VGSGLNEKRKGFLRLLEIVIEEKSLKDKLMRGPIKISRLLNPKSYVSPFKIKIA